MPKFIVPLEQIKQPFPALDLGNPQLVAGHAVFSVESEQDLSTKLLRSLEWFPGIERIVCQRDNSLAGQVVVLAATKLDAIDSVRMLPLLDNEAVRTEGTALMLSDPLFSAVCQLDSAELTIALLEYRNNYYLTPAGILNTLCGLAVAAKLGVLVEFLDGVKKTGIICRTITDPNERSVYRLRYPDDSAGLREVRFNPEDVLSDSSGVWHLEGPGISLTNLAVRFHPYTNL